MQEIINQNPVAVMTIVLAVIGIVLLMKDKNGLAYLFFAGAAIVPRVLYSLGHVDSLRSAIH